MYAKTFPYAYVNSLMEWKRLASYLHVSHIPTVKVSHVISFLSPPISFVWFIFFWKWHCVKWLYYYQICTFLYMCYQRIVQHKLSTFEAETQEKKKPHSCQGRSEPIVWMFLNYIHFLFVRSAHLTPPQSTGPEDRATFIVCGMKVS